MKLYGIDGHVMLLLTFVFERWTRSDSSPIASAEYIRRARSVALNHVSTAPSVERVVMRIGAGLEANTMTSVLMTLVRLLRPLLKR